MEVKSSWRQPMGVEAFCVNDVHLKFFKFTEYCVNVGKLQNNLNWFSLEEDNNLERKKNQNFDH